MTIDNATSFQSAGFSAVVRDAVGQKGVLPRPWPIPLPLPKPPFPWP